VAVSYDSAATAGIDLVLATDIGLELDSVSPWHLRGEGSILL